MNWATAVVIIVAIWGLVQVLRKPPQPQLGHDRDEDDDGSRALSAPRERELKAEIEMLRERLEVLERITTDANSNEVRARKRLEAEIESLRERD